VEEVLVEGMPKDESVLADLIDKVGDDVLFALRKVGFDLFSGAEFEGVGGLEELEEDVKVEGGVVL
jgi:hypothetical protein